MRLLACLCASSLHLLTGCTVAQRRALTPETVGVTVGGGVGFDRDGERRGPRNLGINVTVTPVWRIKPAPVAKVADTTTTTSTP